MTAVSVVNRKREKLSTLEVESALLEGVINRLALSDCVRAQLANLREGNASTKTRGDVNGSTKKRVRQKGTGGARHGSWKAPIFVGGGTVFGPHPRDYSISLPKKLRQLGFLSALRLKWKDGQVLVVGDLSFAKPKTQEAAQYFSDLAVRSATVVLGSRDEAVQKSIRNIPFLTTVLADGVRLLDVMRREYVVFTPDALKRLESRVLGGNAQ